MLQYVQGLQVLLPDSLCSGKLKLIMICTDGHLQMLPVIVVLHFPEYRVAKDQTNTV